MNPKQPNKPLLNNTHKKFQRKQLVNMCKYINSSAQLEYRSWINQPVYVQTELEAGAVCWMWMRRLRASFGQSLSPVALCRHAYLHLFRCTFMQYLDNFAVWKCNQSLTSRLLTVLVSNFQECFFTRITNRSSKQQVATLFWIWSS